MYENYSLNGARNASMFRSERKYNVGSEKYHKRR